jgi:DNA-binding LytR/AlgR family response regulator
MILNVKNAEYIDGYKVFLTFNNGESVLADLENTVFSDTRRIFIPLRDIDYFKSFKIYLNTITWDNEADFAPEFLLELGKQQESKKMEFV